jgi:hypothetical protein
MKRYSIPVTHTATVVTEHQVEAKSKQEAMFKLGQVLQDTSSPFECVMDSVTARVDVELSAGQPEVVEPTPLDTGI